jgi:hypothetical protein
MYNMFNSWVNISDSVVSVSVSGKYDDFETTKLLYLTKHLSKIVHEYSINTCFLCFGSHDRGRNLINHIRIVM